MIRKKDIVRDTDATPFHEVLNTLLSRVAGAYGAVLVDVEGEAVDYAGELDPFDLRVAGAHFRIVLGEVSRALPNPVREIVIRGTRGSFIVRALPESYALVVLLSRGAGFVSAARAFQVAEHAIGLEAGWASATENWQCVQVAYDQERKPLRMRVQNVWVHLDVMGRVIELRHRDRGYWVRLQDGREGLLVREASGVWYMDQRVQ